MRKKNNNNTQTKNIHTQTYNYACTVQRYYSNQNRKWDGKWVPAKMRWCSVSGE